MHVDSWRTTYKDIVPDDYLNKLSYENCEQLWADNLSKGNVFIAKNDQGQVIGFAKGGKERSKQYKGYLGELYAIYTLEEAHGKGVGEGLLKAVVDDLKKQKIDSMIVLVLEENKARYFYERFGAKWLDTVEIEIDGKKLKEVVYGWESTSRLTR